MSAALDKACKELKSYCIAMLVMSALSGNPVIMIVGIVGASYIVCCSSSRSRS